MTEHAEGNDRSKHVKARGEGYTFQQNAWEPMRAVFYFAGRLRDRFETRVSKKQRQQTVAETTRAVREKGNVV